MKVLLINYYDNMGGAAKAVFKLHNRLRLFGIDSLMLVQRKISNQNFVFLHKDYINKFFPLIRSYLDIFFLYFYKKRVRTYWSTGFFSNGINRTIESINPDIVQLNWVSSGFVSIRDVSKIKKPIIWRLSDSWPITGGCHIPFECKNYEMFCGKCPLLGSSKLKDLSYFTLKRKMKYWSNINMTVVTPSKWMAGCVARSSVFKNKTIKIIPTGVDTNIFRPGNRFEMRKFLNLSLEKKIILFGAYASTTDKNKGFSYLQLALEKLLLNESSDEFELIVFGNSNQNTLQKINAKFMGIISDPLILAQYYVSADVFILPSLLENLSNALIEALACGTPAIAFDTGGNSDIIDHKINGYLARLHDVDDLKDGISWVLNNKEYEFLCKAAREKALNNFDIDMVTKKYIELYKEVCNNGEQL